MEIINLERKGWTLKSNDGSFDWMKWEINSERQCSVSVEGKNLISLEKKFKRVCKKDRCRHLERWKNFGERNYRGNFIRMNFVVKNQILKTLAIWIVKWLSNKFKYVLIIMS